MAFLLHSDFVVPKYAQKLLRAISQSEWEGNLEKYQRSYSTEPNWNAPWSLDEEKNGYVTRDQLLYVAYMCYIVKAGL